MRDTVASCFLLSTSLSTSLSDPIFSHLSTLLRIFFIFMCTLSYRELILSQSYLIYHQTLGTFKFFSYLSSCIFCVSLFYFVYFVRFFFPSALCDFLDAMKCVACFIHKCLQVPCDHGCSSDQKCFQWSSFSPSS